MNSHTKWPKRAGNQNSNNRENLTKLVYMRYIWDIKIIKNGYARNKISNHFQNVKKIIYLTGGYF